jgi:ABC-type Mn2+/Zn2+ transport system ATPase subunit
MNTVGLIQITNLSTRYGNETVLDKINLEINQGEFVVLCGSNGSGKSTFVKAILGLIESSSHIMINSQEWSQKLVARHFGYVPQYINIDRNFPITVREIIELECRNAKECHMSPVDHLNYLSASYLVDRKLSELSGGELQRVLIARALVNDPEILILDEPINNLDAKTQRELFSLLVELNKKGQTIILISHDDHIVDKLENPRIILFENKTIKEIDHPEHIH